jgi:hypothetical protein
LLQRLSRRYIPFGDLCYIALSPSRIAKQFASNRNHEGLRTQKQKQRRQKIQHTDCKEDFLPNLIKSIAILELIEVGIKLFQDDHVSLSMVYEHFAVSMVQSFRIMGCLTCTEATYKLDLLQDRLDLMFGDAIGLSLSLIPLSLEMACVQVIRSERKMRSSSLLPSACTNGRERR